MTRPADVETSIYRVSLFLLARIFSSLQKKSFLLGKDFKQSFLALRASFAIRAFQGDAINRRLYIAMIFFDQPELPRSTIIVPFRSLIAKQSLPACLWKLNNIAPVME